MVAATNRDVERSDGGGPKKIFVMALRSLSSPAALATRIAASSPAKAIRRATKRLSLPTAVRSKWFRKTNKVHDGIMPEEHHTPSKRLFLLNGDGNIETGSFNISFTDLLKSPPSNPHSRTYSLTSASSRKSSQSDIYIPLRRYPTIRPDDNPSTTTTSPPDRASSTPSSVKEQDLIIRRPRRLRSYSGLEERKDPLAHFARILSNITHYFYLRNATTTIQRRECLYDLPRECRNECAHWLATHPRDQWDSDEEEEANFSRMFADEYAEIVERNFEETGFWDFVWQEEDGEDREEDVEFEERAEVVGWVQARQEKLFDEEWVTGNGRWGKGKGCEKGVGPDGEVV